MDTPLEKDEVIFHTGKKIPPKPSLGGIQTESLSKTALFQAFARLTA